MEVDETDQRNLSIDKNPVARNIYINQTYDVQAKELSTCLQLDEPFANWFHFAAWASKSAGNVISGQKFERFKKIKKSLLSLATAVRVIPSKERQQEIFAPPGVFQASCTFQEAWGRPHQGFWVHFPSSLALRNNSNPESRWPDSEHSTS